MIIDEIRGIEREESTNRVSESNDIGIERFANDESLTLIVELALLSDNVCEEMYDWFFHEVVVEEEKENG